MVQFKVVWQNNNGDQHFKIYNDVKTADDARRYLLKNKAKNVDVIAIFTVVDGDLSTVFPGKVVRGA